MAQDLKIQSKHLVSIIMPAYNAEKYVQQAIASVINQTYQNWELVIANDNSRDLTGKIVEQAASQDSRIRLINLDSNVGPAEARNSALEESRGRFVAFLDCDDTWVPNKIEVQVRFLLEHNAAFCFSAYRRMSLDGSRVGKLIEVPQTITYNQLLYQNVIGTLTAMLDRKLTGPIKMTNQGYDDFILWLQILRQGYTGYGIQQDLARYRIVDGSVSRNKLRAANWTWNVYRNVEGFPFLKSAYYFSIYSIKNLAKHRNL